MQYTTNPKNGEQLSRLGLGCMRFPRNGRRIDQDRTNKLVGAAVDIGVNYFDTAYIYPGSEEALGAALAADGRRDEINIATKLPHYMCKKPEDFDKIFETQLKRLGTGRIDYYLIHMLSNVKSWERVKSLGIVQWIAEKRRAGEIRNLGFSFHGGRADFLELLDAYDWDFCMVQYNYYDENNQASIHGVREAHKRGIPVIAMEPLRGGMLAGNLPERAIRSFRNANNERTPADWALRWLLDQQEVTMTLSGMSCIEQLEENSAVVNDAASGALAGDEPDVYREAVAALNETVRNPCTACGYCMPCPRGVDIPGCFSCYNESYLRSLGSGLGKYIQIAGLTTPMRSDASKCNACGRCLTLCPQGIEIPKELKKVKRRMLYFVVGPLMAIMRRANGVRG